MNRRMWKWAGLMCCGGVLLQLGGGCGSLIVNLALQQLPTILLGLLSQLLSSATTTA